MAWASDKACNYCYSALYRDTSPETAKWCGVPAPPSPFSHRRTRNYHQWASHGVALLSDHARYALDRRNRLYVMVRSCLVAPETGRKRLLSRKQKGETGRGLVRNRTRVESSLLVLVRLPSHRPKPTQTTSAPTSTRDEPHVGTHICARPLKYTNPEFLERSRPSFCKPNTGCF